MALKGSDIAFCATCGAKGIRRRVRAGHTQCLQCKKEAVERLAATVTEAARKAGVHGKRGRLHCLRLVVEANVAGAGVWAWRGEKPASVTQPRIPSRCVRCGSDDVSRSTPIFQESRLEVAWEWTIGGGRREHYLERRDGEDALRIEAWTCPRCWRRNIAVKALFAILALGCLGTIGGTVLSVRAGILAGTISTDPADLPVWALYAWLVCPLSFFALAWAAHSHYLSVHVALKRGSAWPDDPVEAMERGETLSWLLVIASKCEYVPSAVEGGGGSP